VPAYWIETQFNSADNELQILEKLYTWGRHGLNKQESESLKAFIESNPKMDTNQIDFRIWSYVDAVCTDHNKLLEESGIVKKVNSNVDSDRKRLL
jgi:predicted transcriptional regulator